jgi:hypothetical protein
MLAARARERERERDGQVRLSVSLRFQSADLMPIITVLGQIVRRPPAVFYDINYVYSLLCRIAAYAIESPEEFRCDPCEKQDLPVVSRLMTSFHRRIAERLIERASSTSIIRLEPRAFSHPSGKFRDETHPRATLFSASIRNYPSRQRYISRSTTCG